MQEGHVDREDAERRLPELRRDRARLSLAVQSDPQFAAELADIESQIISCTLAIERAGLVAGERDRLDAESRELAEAEARRTALDQARSLQSERERAARAIDSGARRFAVALADYSRIVIDQDRALTAADRRPSPNASRAREYAVQAAIVFALEQASAPRLVDLPPIPPRDVRPLTDGDHRPIEPENNDKKEQANE